MLNCVGARRRANLAGCPPLSRATILARVNSRRKASILAADVPLGWAPPGARQGEDLSARIVRGVSCAPHGGWQVRLFIG